jgi:hypothetical protein
LWIFLICLLSELETILLAMKAVFGSIVLIIILCGVGVLAWRRRPRGERHVEVFQGTAGVLIPTAPEVFVLGICSSELHLETGQPSCWGHRRTWDNSPTK